MRRIFLGIEVPAPQRDLLAMEQFLLPGIRPTNPEGFHLTLVFLGETADALALAVDEEMSRLSAPPLALSLRALGLFGGAKPHAVWAGVAPEPALDRLQEKVQRACRRAGWTGPAQRFHPHVTLGRMGRMDPVAQARLERAVILGAGFASPPFPVEGVTLYESRPVASGGRRYVPLARYALGK